MFVIRATCGWNVSAVSIWKDETSQTITSSLRLISDASEKGYPMLPTTCVTFPLLAKISPSRETVVVLPFVPVTAHIGDCAKL